MGIGEEQPATSSAIAPMNTSAIKAGNTTRAGNLVFIRAPFPTEPPPWPFLLDRVVFFIVPTRCEAFLVSHPRKNSSMLAALNWITQAAAGAVLGEIMLGKRLGRPALAWGALIGLLPEIPGLLPLVFLSTRAVLVWTQGISHSLPITALAAWGVIEGLFRLWKPYKIARPEIVRCVAAIWGLHLLLDCISTPGIPLLWPLPGGPVSLDLLTAWDPVILLALSVAAIWLACIPADKPAKKSRAKKPKPVPRSKRRKVLNISLGIAAGYLLLAGGFKLLASGGFSADLARRGTKFSRQREGPVSGNIFLRRAVVDRDTEFWVGYRSVFEGGSAPVRWTVYTRNAEALARVATEGETKSLQAHTGGWWLAHPDVQGAWLADMRFPEVRVWGNKKDAVDSRLAESWLILPAQKSDRLRFIRPGDGDTWDYLKRMARRTFNGRDAWEANPRLAGVPGSLPEFLPVEE